MTGGRHVSQYPQPAKRINALEGLERPSRNALAANPVVPIASGDEIALKLMCPPVLPIAHLRVRAVEVRDGHLGRVEYQFTGGSRRVFKKTLVNSVCP